MKETISKLEEKVNELNHIHKLSKKSPCQFEILSEHGGYQVVLSANPPYRYYVYPVTIGYKSEKDTLKELIGEELQGNLTEDIAYCRFRVFRNYKGRF